MTAEDDDEAWVKELQQELRKNTKVLKKRRRPLPEEDIPVWMKRKPAPDDGLPTDAEIEDALNDPEIKKLIEQ